MASFVISIAALQRNTAILREVKEAAGCRLVLALKGFSCWKAFPYIRDDLDGCCASGLWEGLLAKETFGKAVLSYSPAYTEEDITQLVEFSTHLDFNSLSQWLRFRDRIMDHPRFRSGDLHCGLRINPELSTAATPLYDPCAEGSRLGITAEQLMGADLRGISGLHFHTLCEQGSDALEATLEAVDRKFGSLLQSPDITYLNMGGGHWITKPDYDRKHLVELIRRTREKYQTEVWLEPGEAVAIHTGVLRAEVVDTFESMGHRHAILDVSATGHMPDVLEMPYRPEVFLANGTPAVPSAGAETHPAVTYPDENYVLAANPSATPATPSSWVAYRLGCPSCLAGDTLGEYAFPRPLTPGDTLVFDDMAHYTMVKTTTFNGLRHPSIVLQHPDGMLETVRNFDYSDFRDRLS